MYGMHMYIIDRQMHRSLLLDFFYGFTSSAGIISAAGLQLPRAEMGLAGGLPKVPSQRVQAPKTCPDSYLPLSLYICICLYLYMYIYLCIYIYVIYIYIYIHTYAYMCVSRPPSTIILEYLQHQGSVCKTLGLLTSFAIEKSELTGWLWRSEGS